MLGEQGFGQLLGLFDQVGVGVEVGVTQQGDAALAAADKFAGAAQFKVLPGDFKAVGVFVDDFQALAGGGRERLGVEQDAAAFIRPASDTPA